MNPTTEQIWRWVAEYIHRKHIPPTLREISDGCYVARTTAMRHLDRLEAKGYIERYDNVARGLALLCEPPAKEIAL